MTVPLTDGVGFVRRATNVGLGLGAPESFVVGGCGRPMTDTRAAETREGSRPETHRLARLTLLVGFLAYATLFAILLHTGGRYTPLVLTAAAWPAAIAMVVLLVRCRLPAHAAAIAIGGGSALVQAIGLSAAPSTSDDVYRYIWDGKVQLAGIDPYRYAPQAPQLAQLRDGLLFGPTSTCAHPVPGGCTAINRPDVHTVYPPVAQGLFDAVRIASAGQGGVRPFQILAALGVLAVTAVLLAHAHRRGGALWPAALWAWSPLVVIEYANNAHIDWSAALLGVLALTLARGQRFAWAGVLLGAATLTKLYPALLVAALLRRRPLIVLASAAAFVAAAYLPHVLAVGHAVIGYLPGYLQEEGYSSGSRSLLLGAILPHPLDTAVGVIALGAAAVWCWRRSVTEAPEQVATVFVGVAFLIATPAYGWYGGLLLALVVMSARYEWLPVVVAPTLCYLVREEITQAPRPESVIYAIAGVAAAAGVYLKRRRAELRTGPAAHV